MITTLALALVTAWFPPHPTGVAPDIAPFASELDALSRGPACDGRAQLADDPNHDALVSHCEKLATSVQKWRDGWFATATPFFREVVPAEASPRVVYPFGGADLLTALTIFPDAHEITILALEPGGDPRSLATLSGPALDRNLKVVRQYFDFLTRLNFSRTVDLDELSKDMLAGVLIYDLAALGVLGYEPLELTYFTLGPGGGRLYLGRAELASIDVAAAKIKDAGRRAKFLADAFPNFELRFRKKGSAAAPVQVFRHISADLEDPGMRTSNVLAHLQLKGRITAMTKASSYLLWHTSFSKLRNWMLANLDWMISDSTGFAPDQVDKATIEQITYGMFDGPIITHPRDRAKRSIAMWHENPERPLAFAFGYPDIHDNHSLLITRRRVP